jgi:Universal stress protein family
MARASLGKEMSEYGQILVAYDESNNAERALSRAISLAKEGTATLSIVVMVPPSAYEETVRNGRNVLGKASTLGPDKFSVRLERYCGMVDPPMRFCRSRRNRKSISL